jgi:hypothetical protein
VNRRLDTALGLDGFRGPFAVLVRTALYALVVFIFAGPLLALLVSAFSPVTDPTRLTLIPHHLTPANFRTAVDQGVLRYLLNSLIVVGGGLLLQIMVSISAAFALARKQFPGLRLVMLLGVSNLRIAGNTLDRDTLWVPQGQPPPDPKPDWVQDLVTPNDIQRLRRLLDTTGWKAEVGVNLGRWDAALGADQAKAMTKILGRKLVAVECGNEPDQWEGKALRPGTRTRSTTPTGWPAPTRSATTGSPAPTPPAHRRPGPPRWPLTSTTGWPC